MALQSVDISSNGIAHDHGFFSMSVYEILKLNPLDGVVY